MPIVPTWLHAALDYALALLVMVSPWLFAYDDQGPATWSAIGLATIIFTYSLATRYELAIWRVIPMRTHLVLDGMAGIALIASPWTLGFVEDTWLVHVGAGVLWLAGAVTSQTVPLRMRSI